MQLREQILASRSKENVMRVAAQACSSPARFRELVACYLEKHDHQLAWVAGWSLSWAAKQCPELVAPHLDAIIAQLESEKQNDSLRRSAARILEDIDIPEKYHGRVMNACFRFVEDPNAAIAVKAFCLTTLFRLSKIYTDIIPELRALIEDRMPGESAAFRSRAKKMLAAWAKK